MTEPTETFTDRVDDYVRHRPSYPAELVRILEREAGIAAEETRVVDLGCGTGLSSALFLAEGYAVTGVEPNAAMRAAARRQLADAPRFRAVDGTAERSTLPDGAADLVFAGQAWHWFDPQPTRKEMRRLLAPDGRVALAWNHRRTGSTPFLAGYEELLLRYGRDYADLARRAGSDERVRAFFGPGGCTFRECATHQDLDRAGLVGRAVSSSYVPGPGEPGHDELLAALGRVFDEHARDGRVRIEYDTRLYFGRLTD